MIVGCFCKRSEFVFDDINHFTSRNRQFIREWQMDAGGITVFF